MLFLMIAAFFLALSIFSILKEKRRFRNGIYLILFFMSFALGAIFQLSDYNVDIANIVALIFLFLGLVIVCMILFLLFWDTYLMCKKEGKSLSSFLPAGFACVIIVFLIASFEIITDIKAPVWLIILITLGFFILLYFAIFFWAFWLYSFVYSFIPKKVDCDYIIIHGAGLLNGNQMSPLLAGRIDHAIMLYEKGHREAKLIASGGQGGDETISEAAAIQTYLLEKGIAQDDILMEDKSTTTYENLQYSKAIMDQLKTAYTCLFVTNNYHIFRTAMYARKLGIKGEGAGAKTAWYYWPTAFIREYIALIVIFKWSLIIWILVWSVCIIIAMLPFNLFR